MDVWELLHQFHHPVVVLQGMQSHPGKAILAGYHVLVERLVHMPQEHQPDFPPVLAHRFLILRNKCNRGFTQIERATVVWRDTLVGELECSGVPKRKGTSAISHLR